LLADAGGEPVGVVQGQGAEGLFPVLDDGALDEAGGGFALVSGEPFLGGAFAGALVFDVADGQPQQLDDGVVAGEVAAVLDDLAELVIQRLDRVGGAGDLADRGEGTPGTA
jgi:hypothetical protein